jgi:hypothetical protein
MITRNIRSTHVLIELVTKPTIRAAMSPFTKNATLNILFLLICQYRLIFTYHPQRESVSIIGNFAYYVKRFSFKMPNNSDMSLSQEGSGDFFKGSLTFCFIVSIV